MHRIAFTLVAAAAMAGCGSDESPVHFVNLADGDYLGGPQTTQVEVDADIPTTRADLYLDGALIATDDVAPFVLIWTTRDIRSGASQLRARVYRRDGNALETSVLVHIDNSPPNIQSIPRGAAQGQPLIIEATDDGEIERTVITTAAYELTSTEAQPLAVLWPFGCGVEDIEVRVTDRAGWTTSQRVSMRSGKAGDLDCDSHRAADQGGDDCDDIAPEVYPGKPDPGGLADLNCDGVPGIDYDGDGVASEETGGEDCDDTAASIHGERVVFRPTRVNTWSPGSAALIANQVGNSAWELALWHEGAIEHITGARTGGVSVGALVTAEGANPGSIAMAATYSGQGLIAFGRGNSLIIVDNRAPWTQRAVLDAGQPVGRISLDVFDLQPGVGGHVVFQAGTDIWYGSNENGVWTTRAVARADEILVDPPLLSRSNVVYRTSTGIWAVELHASEAAPRRIDPPLFEGVRAALAVYGGQVFYAINHDGVGSVFLADTLDVRPQIVTRPVRRILTAPGRIFVDVDGEPLQAYKLRNGAVVPGVSTAFPELLGIELVAGFSTLAAAGYVYTPDDAWVYPAEEVSDGRDQDCDGVAL